MFFLIFGKGGNCPVALPEQSISVLSNRAMSCFYTSKFATLKLRRIYET